MKIPELPKLPEAEDAKRALARALVELGRDTVSLPKSFMIEHYGTTFEVEARAKQTEGARIYKDITEHYPDRGSSIDVEARKLSTARTGRFVFNCYFSGILRDFRP